MIVRHESREVCQINSPPVLLGFLLLQSRRRSAQNPLSTCTAWALLVKLTAARGPIAVTHGAKRVWDLCETRGGPAHSRPW